MKLRAYKAGSATDISDLTNRLDAVVEVELPDGRTVQLAVDDIGRINLRAWGNTPCKVGNDASISLHMILPFQEQTTCEKCTYPKEHLDPYKRCMCKGNNDES